MSTADEIVRSGVPMKAQVLGRPTGLLLGLELSYNPFSLYPSYREIADLPLEQRVAEMRKQEVRACILSESRTGRRSRRSIISPISTGCSRSAIRPTMSRRWKAASSPAPRAKAASRRRSSMTRFWNRTGTRS
ncbi:hypothetical protein ACFSTI_15030 [Rhizorhabdus histidinilytica]